MLCEWLRITRKRNSGARLRQTGTTGKSLQFLSIPSRKNIPLNASGKSAA